MLHSRKGGLLFLYQSFGQVVQDFRVIQYSVHIAAPACVIQIITVRPSVVEDGHRTFCSVAKQSCSSHVYLVAATAVGDGSRTAFTGTVLA